MSVRTQPTNSPRKPSGGTVPSTDGEGGQSMDEAAAENFGLTADDLDEEENDAAQQPTQTFG